ncbi:MAG: restriction endonuclease subunit S [Dehalococcoidia bacterium]
MVRVSDVTSLNPRRSVTGLLPETEVSFVPMPAVSELTASIEAPEVRTLRQVQSGYTPFENGDVLFAKITPCMENGKVALAAGLKNGVGFGSTEFHVLRANGSVLPRFVYYFVRQPSFRLAARQRMQGAAGQQRVPAEFLASYPIPVPPLYEQRRIVEILDKAETLRRKRAEANAKADRILPALFIKMFGDPATNPMGWPEVSMQELFEDSPIYGTMIPPNAANGEWLDLRVANIQNGKLDLSSRKYVDLPVELVPRFRLKDGDLLLARAIGSLDHLGKCFIAYPMAEKWTFDSHLMRVRLRQDRVLPETIVGFLTSTAGRRSFLGNTRRSAVQFNINTKEFGAIRLPLPPIAVQQLFAVRVSELRLLLLQQVESQQRLDSLFDVLLHRAFSGELTAKWREAHMSELVEEMEEQEREVATVVSWKLRDEDRISRHEISPPWKFSGPS